MNMPRKPKQEKLAWKEDWQVKIKTLNKWAGPGTPLLMEKQAEKELWKETPKNTMGPGLDPPQDMWPIPSNRLSHAVTQPQSALCHLQPLSFSLKALPDKHTILYSSGPQSP